MGIGDNTLRMLMLFLIGASFYLYAQRVPMKAWLAVAAAIVFVASAILLANYRLVEPFRSRTSCSTWQSGYRRTGT